MVDLSFDTPLSGSDYGVHATGTIIAGKTGHIMITVTVTNNISSRNDLFYQAFNISNVSGTATLLSHATYDIAIMPEVHTGDTVNPKMAWSYS